MKRSAYDRSIDCLRWIYDGQIGTPAILDSQGHFPSRARFSGAWPAFRQEALQLEQSLASVPRFHELMPQQKSLSAHDRRDWRLFVLKAYGVDFPDNAARCPKLSAAVAASPEVISAVLSFMAPGKVVPPHRGPFRGIVRYYLGLSVPPADDGLPGTTLTIDGLPHRLGEGEDLLWDDTYLHDIRNESAGVRIALLLDIRRQRMSLPLVWLSVGLVALAGLVVRLRLRPAPRKSL